MPTFAATFPSLQDDVVRPLLQYARSRVRNPALAEDAVAATLLVAVESRTEFGAPAAALAWLRGVLRHKLADELRRQHRETPSDEDTLGERETLWVGDADGTRGDPESGSMHRELMQRLHAACAQLPARQRAAIVLRDLCDRDADEVCRTLGVQPGHLWVLVHRARRTLRDRLAV